MSANRSIISELHRIAEAHRGELHPSDVVEAARPAKSILHSKFEWDDTEAAEQYRLWQARQLIRVTVTLTGSEDKPILSRVFVSLKSDRSDDGGYRTVQSVMSDPRSRSQLLQDALEDMRLFQRKYRELEELAAIFRVMDATKPKLKKSTSKQKNAGV